MRVKVFISRELGVYSPFRNHLNSSIIEVIDESLIDFKPVEFEIIVSEWLFFYSKSGVKYFLNQIEKAPSNKIATFGRSTAVYYQNLTNHKPEFIGSGEKHDVAKIFEKEKNFQSCCFILGKNSLRSVQKLMNIKRHSEVIVYDNFPKEKISISMPDIAVFTSPMSVYTYFKNYKSRIHPNIAIGISTADALKETNKEITDIATTPDEKSLAIAVNLYLEGHKET